MARVIPLVPGPDGARRLCLELPLMEGALFGSLPARLERVLTDPGSHRRVLERLFPPSYSDAGQERENRRLLGGALLDGRRELLRGIKSLIVAAESGPEGLRVVLGDAEADLLLRFVNDLRLLLATELGLEKNLGEVDLSPDDPAAPQYSLLVWLGGLESIMLDALLAPPPG